MRYVLQAMAMLGDILIILACALVLVLTKFREPIVWILVFLVFLQWKKSGDFEAWEPKTIRQFMANAKKYGL